MAGLQTWNGFSVGDKVKCSAEYDVNGTHLASFVRSNTYEIIQIGGNNLPNDRVVIGINGKVTAAVDIKYLTNLSSTATPTPPTPPAPEPEPPKEESPAVDINALTDALLSNTQSNDFNIGNDHEGNVQLPYPEFRANSEMSDDYVYQINAMLNARREAQMSADDLAKLDRRDPSLVQNAYQFPKSKGLDTTTGYYRYDYYMSFQSSGLVSGLSYWGDNDIRKASNIDVISRGSLVSKYVSNYNKYKLLNANDVLSHSFAHVFFVRPDCNILSGPETLAKKVSGYSEFFYALKRAPFLLRELTQVDASYNHELALYLSNKAGSFEVSDEYITTDTYGESLTGFKIPYGKTNIESQAAGKFSITYKDDRDLHIYHLHKLWTDYISYVYRGKLNPKDQYIINKVLDYPTCVYYILTAEDGETIIFWSKYWGVFPIEAPSSGFSYNIDNAGGVSNPELKIEYQFAWKEDFNPLSLIEFNKHTIKIPFRYVPHYQEIKVGTGYTWSGPPFIETISNPNGLEIPYTFKLRFRPST